MLTLTRLRGRSRFGAAKARGLSKGEGGRSRNSKSLLEQGPAARRPDPGMRTRSWNADQILECGKENGAARGGAVPRTTHKGVTG